MTHPRFAAPGPSGRRLRPAAALTLVEVMMALTVLALTVTTTITTLQRAFLNLDSARCLETASRIIECELEKERLLAWSSVSDASYQPAIDTSFTRDPTIASRFTLSRGLTIVSNHANKLIQVTLTVNWRSFDGRSLSRNHTTYFSEGGLNGFIYAKS